jgi:hypothetical protein
VQVNCSSNTSDKQPNHCYLDECLACLDLALVIFTQASTERKPPECSLHHPPAGPDAEPAYAGPALYHFQLPVALRFAPVKQRLPSRLLGQPKFFETWHQRSKPCQKATSSSGVMHIGRRDLDKNRHAQCVNQEMTLPPLDMLMGVKPRNAG